LRAGVRAGTVLHVPLTDGSLFAGIDQARNTMAALASQPADDSSQMVAWIDLEIAKLDHLRSDLVALRERVATRAQLQLSVPEP
jgi:hypothetical protein